MCKAWILKATKRNSYITYEVYCQGYYTIIQCTFQTILYFYVLNTDWAQATHGLLVM